MILNVGCGQCSQPRPSW